MTATTRTVRRQQSFSDLSPQDERIFIAQLTCGVDPVRTLEQFELTEKSFSTDANRLAFRAILANAAENERAWLLQAIKAGRPTQELGLIVDRIGLIEARMEPK